MRTRDGKAVWDGDERMEGKAGLLTGHPLQFSSMAHSQVIVKVSSIVSKSLSRAGYDCMLSDIRYGPGFLGKTDLQHSCS